jgi:hypothetical protein
MSTLFDLSTIDTNLPTIKLCCEGLDKLREAREFLTNNQDLFDDFDELITAAVKLDNMMARLRVKRAKLEG